MLFKIRISSLVYQSWALSGAKALVFPRLEESALYLGHDFKSPEIHEMFVLGSRQIITCQIIFYLIF